MSEDKDIYKSWRSDLEAMPPSIPAESLVQSTENHSALRSFKWIGSLVLACVCGFGLVVLGGWYLARNRGTAADKQRTESVLALQAAGAEAQRVVAQASALATLAEQQVAGLRRAADSRLVSAAEMAPVLEAVARLKASLATAREAVSRVAATEGEIRNSSADRIESLNKAGREAAEAAGKALEQMKADAQVIHAAHEMLSLRSQAAEQARQDSLQKAREEEARSSIEREKAQLHDSVNRQLLEPGLSLVMIVDANDRPLWETMDDLSRRLNQAGWKTQSRALTPVFYASPLVRGLDEQPERLLAALDIGCERLIVGRLNLEERAPDANGFITTDCSGKLTVTDRTGRVYGTVTLDASGASPTRSSSRDEALAKALRNLDWDKLISLRNP